MRLDRLVTLRIVHPLLKLRSSAEPRLPILMYHSISTDPEKEQSAYYKVCTSPDRFAEQMDWLAGNGYEGVTLGEGLKRLGSPNEANKHKPVVITFDDGFRDFYTEAFLTLQRHRFHATMYLPAAFIGEQRCRFLSRDCLTWNEVAELHSAGTEFGSHTVNHPKLIECDWIQIGEELRESKSLIEQRLCSEVNAFAYPYAFPQAQKDFVASFRQSLKEAGYQTCATTGVGRARAGDDLFSLKRLPINDADDPLLLRAKIEGAYDWIAIPQAAVKAARQAVRPRCTRSPARQTQPGAIV